MTTPPTPHRWSGWPGAWCLDCGAEDAREICLADHIDEVFDVALVSEDNPYGMRVHCVNGPCPTPGQSLQDPYAIIDDRDRG